MNIGKLKQNKGISMADIVIAMLILSMFAGVIGTLYYKILYHSSYIELNAIAVYYAIKVAEDIDKMSFEQVNEDLSNYIKVNYELPESFSIELEVENYNETNIPKQDILRLQIIDRISKQDTLKIVTIKVNYNCLNEQKNYQLQKLKVKEINFQWSESELGQENQGSGVLNLN